MARLTIAICLLVHLTVSAASAQQLIPRALTISVQDTAGGGVDGARLLLSPGKKTARTAANGLYTFGRLTPGNYRLEVNRLGFAPAAVDLSVPDSGAWATVRLSPLPRQLEAAVISERRQQLPRVYDRQRKRLGHVVFAEDLPKYQAFSVADIFMRVPEFSALLSATRTCSTRSIFVDGLHVPAQWKVEEYVRPEEIMAIEVHRSADFIKEDFLTFAPDPPTPRPSVRVGAITLGARPPRVSQSLTGTCGRVVLIWTWWYRGR